MMGAIWLPSQTHVLLSVKLGLVTRTMPNLRDTNQIKPDLRCVVWRSLSACALGGRLLIERDGKPKNQERERTGDSSPV
jgi:hypothetical protein